MRTLFVLTMVLLTALAAGASAQAPSSRPAPVSAPPVSGQAPLEVPTAAHPRLTAEQRFIQANTGKDGHLTLAEARQGYPSVARHFQQIDTEDKGYVTQDDIRAWHKMQRAARRQGQAVEDHMSPRQAYQRYFPGQRQFNTSANRTVPRSVDGPPPMAAPEDEAR